MIKDKYKCISLIVRSFYKRNISHKQTLKETDVVSLSKHVFKQLKNKFNKYSIFKFFFDSHCVNVLILTSRGDVYTTDSDLLIGN